MKGTQSMNAWNCEPHSKTVPQHSQKPIKLQMICTYLVHVQAVY